MITLQFFCDLIGATLCVNRYPNQNNRWSASFDRCEIKDDGVLISAHGNGTTPESAINEYIAKITGKTLVFNARSERRQEFVVPAGIVY